MLTRLLLTILLVLGGFVAGLVVMRGERSAPTAASPALEAAAAPVAEQSGGRPAELGARPDFAAVAGQAVRAVTNISSVDTRRRPSPFGSDPFFRYFFGDEADLFGYERRPSLGSGVIVSSDGYVLTNAHVVGDPRSQVTVALSDKRELHAEVVGIDQGTDIALLKIDASNLATIPWGNSADLRVAEWVLAIGNPEQLSQTVTLGIVSALGRANLGIAAYEDFIQTDAAINPGNSGGALINGRGELVGINTAIFNPAAGYQGIGFAVPSNLARRVMQDLIRYGEVRRGTIGYVEIAPITTRIASELGVPDVQGALIVNMRRDSEAHAAGLRPGDVIVRFEGHPVKDPSHFQRLVSDAKIGATIRVGVVREGRTLEIRIPVVQGRARGRRTI